MLYIKNIVFFTSHQKGCEATPSPSYTHVFSLIFLHFASDLSHNSEIFHPLVYAHPKELLQAHCQNNQAVMQAYTFPVKMAESEYVAELFKLYTKLAES